MILIWGMYQQLWSWLKMSMDEITLPLYQSDSRIRDKKLREHWRLEPYWAGAINQMTLVDSARPWTLTGGRNQVRMYANILHYANNGRGWRQYFRQASLSYRVTDMGSVTELGRYGTYGPLRALYHVDSARCKWTGKERKPLRYYPPTRGRVQDWKPTDFFNVCSMPNDDERFSGLGYCATSRAFELTKLLYGVLMHDQESVGAKMIRGLLLLSGIEEDQWRTAMQSREANLEELERKYFEGVFILAGLGEGDVDAKLVALSQLPAEFDRATFVDQTIFGYAGVLGVDPREIWPVSSGSLGTARESEQQHRKAATKGSLEFPHAFQEKLQAELPETLNFQFGERDTDSELIEAQMAQAWSDVVKTLTEPFTPEGAGLLDPELGLSMLVEKGIARPEWTEHIEETKLESDEQAFRRRTREQFMDYPEVQRSIERNPDEPIIQYRWTPTTSKEVVLWEPRR